MSTSSSPPSPPPSDPTPASAPADPPAAAAAPRRRRSWRRRLTIAGIAVVVLAVGFRLLLLVLLPTVISRIAAQAGVGCRYDRMELSLLGGNAELWGVTITSADGATELVRTDYAHANLSVLDLLGLRLVASRLEVDGVTLDVVRKPDGTIPLLDELAKSAAGRKARPASAAPANFTPPLRIDALRARSIEAKIRDESVSPVFERTLRLDVRVSDLGKPASPAAVELTVASEDLVDALRLTGSADLQGPSVSAMVDFAARGLHASAAAPYLEPLGIVADGNRVDISGAANLALTAAGPGTFQGSAALKNLTVSAGAEPIASLAAADVSIASLSPSDVHCASVTIDGGSVRVGRTASGAMRMTPLTLGPAPAAPAAARPAAPRPAAAPAMAPFRWRIDAVTVKGVEATFDDQFLTPPASIGVGVTSLTIGGLTSAPAPGARATFSAELAAPGLARVVHAKGDASLASDAPALAADVAVDGISLEAAAAYLRPLGIEPTLDAATLRCAVTAKVVPGAEGAAISASVKDAVLREADGSLLELAEVAIDGLRLGSGIDVESIRATGPSLAVTLLETGSLESAGFRYTPPAAAPAAAVARADGEPASGAMTLSLPRIRIGSLTWGGAAVRFEDQTAGAAEAFEIADAGLEVKSLVLDPNAGAPAAEPGSIRAWVRSPGLVDRLEVVGTLRPAPGTLAADIEVVGSGVQLARFAPYLRPLGIEPTLRDGAVSLHAAASVAQTDDGLTLAASLRDATVEQGGEALAAATLLAVERVSLREGSVDVGRITIESASLAAVRHDDGALEVMGVRVLPSEEAAAPTPAVPLDPFALLGSLPKVSFEGLVARGMHLAWKDLATPQPVDVRIALDATLGALSTGNPDAEAATFELKVSAPGVADRFEALGALRITPDSVELDARAEGNGLAAGPLAAYLPPAIEASLRRGSLSTEVAATLSRVDAGGIGASLRVNGFDLRESDAAEALAGLDSLDVRVRRFDAVAGVIDVERIAAAGVAGSAVRRADGRLEILGVALGGSGDEVEVTPAASDDSADVQQIVAAAARGTLPSIAIGEIDLHVERAAFADQTGAIAAPVALTDFRLRTLAPVSVRGDRPASSPPIRIAVTGGVEPVLRRLDVGVSLAPLADRPAAEITVAADGIDGAGLAAFAPGIDRFIDAAPLVDGRLRTSIDVEAAVRRRGPVQVDLTRGVDLTFTVEGTQLRLGEDGPVLAGVERIHGEAVRLDPSTGSVLARSLEVTGLSGSAWRDDAGIHVLGVVVKLDSAPPAPASTDEDLQAQEELAAEEGAAPASPTAPATTSGEIRIDRLTVSGADFTFEDRLLTPPVTIPITGLEADVRGLSSLAMVQDRPVKFNISASAGKISLPKPVRGGVLTGALGDLGRLMAGETVGSTVEMEDREFFSQCIASGTMSFYPTPRGRILAAISGVELTALRGLAQAAGASVGGGIFDGRVELLGRDDGGLDLRSRLVLTDLQYAEPPNGPIARYLSLPVPLDAAIGAVEAADGSITLPIDLTLDGSGLTTGKVLGAASGAIASVLVTAVASTPVKVVTGFAGLFGNTGGDRRWIEEEPITVEFADGVTALSPSARERVERVLRRARSDKNVQVVIEHEFGAADFELAARRANPPRDQARVLAEDLRRRRLDLIARRAELLAPARAAAADPSRAEAAARLREVQAELAEVEDAFDDLYDLLRPGAERQAGRRSRAAALDLADARLDHIRRMVHEVAGAKGDDRVALGNPRAILSDEAASRLVIRIRRAGK